MIRVANAPCSWGILEFNGQAQKLGYAQVLDELQETGYAGTELGDWGFMPTDPGQLRRELAQRNLALLGAFVPVRFRDPQAHDQGEAETLRTARLLSEVAGEAPFIVLADDNGGDETRIQHAGRITPEQGLSSEQWDVFAAGVERVARSVREETGLRSVFHHHAGGFVETPDEVRRLMSLTDPALVGLCFDTGHYCFGGGDPVAAIDEYGSRIWHVHFKDFDEEVARQGRQNAWDYFEAVRNGIFSELGQGSVDFAAVRDALQRYGYDGWIVVEQDVLPGMGTPKASARRNREYLYEIGL